MNGLDSGIDAQSQIIPGEDPPALELLATQYYDRFQPQGPEEVALIDAAISADLMNHGAEIGILSLANVETPDG